MLNYVKHLRPARLSAFIRRPHSVPVRSLSDEAFERLAIYKDADKRPKELEDDQYPKWLWTLLDTQPTKDQLYRHAQKLYDTGGYDAIFEHMPHDHLIRLFRLSAKERIKTNNATGKGGKMF